MWRASLVDDVIRLPEGSNCLKDLNSLPPCIHKSGKFVWRHELLRKSSIVHSVDIQIGVINARDFDGCSSKASRVEVAMAPGRPGNIQMHMTVSYGLSIINDISSINSSASAVIRA